MFSNSNYVDSSGGTVQYGAGPLLSFSGSVGAPDLAAGQTMSTGSATVYQPMTFGRDARAGTELSPGRAVRRHDFRHVRPQHELRNGTVRRGRKLQPPRLQLLYGHR